MSLSPRSRPTVDLVLDKLLLHTPLSIRIHAASIELQQERRNAAKTYEEREWYLELDHDVNFKRLIEAGPPYYCIGEPVAYFICRAFAHSLKRLKRRKDGEVFRDLVAHIEPTDDGWQVRFDNDDSPTYYMVETPPGSYNFVAVARPVQVPPFTIKGTT